jgi:hypothetical protein
MPEPTYDEGYQRGWRDSAEAEGALKMMVIRDREASLYAAISQQALALGHLLRSGVTSCEDQHRVSRLLRELEHAADQAANNHSRQSTEEHKRFSRLHTTS